MFKHAIILAALLTSACSSSTEMVPLLSAAGVPLTDPTEVPLRVVTRSTAVHDPLHVRNTGVVYGDIETTLGHAIASATVTWAKSHQSAKSASDGWELFVEVTNADAWCESVGKFNALFPVGARLGGGTGKSEHNVRVGNEHVGGAQFGSFFTRRANDAVASTRRTSGRSDVAGGEATDDRAPVVRRRSSGRSLGHVEELAESASVRRARNADRE